MPAGIAALLHTVRVLLGYGRHLAETATHRSTGTDFNAIAACFGTGRLHAILAHLQRGILRATALRRVLLERAASGRDISFFAPRERGGVPSAEPDAAPTAQPAEAPVPPKPAARPSRPPGWNEPELYMPTLKDFEAQVRRRPLGRTLVEICLDLAVVPGFCTGSFWNELFEGIRYYGGNVGTLMQEKSRREVAFCKEQDKKMGCNWDWQKMGRDALHRVLGFFIGEMAGDLLEPPAAPGAPGAAAATGPP